MVGSDSDTQVHSLLRCGSRSCNMQGPLHYTDAMAEATTHWSKVWTGQDPAPCGYVDAGLTECQPDGMCSQLVQRIVHLKGTDGIERDRSLQTAVVSSMCWLHTAANSGYDGFTLIMNRCRYKGLVQSLAMIRMPLAASALHMLITCPCCIWRQT